MTYPGNKTPQNQSKGEKVKNVIDGLVMQVLG